MARKVSYREKLRDPRWQRLRLQILDRSDWSCEWCGSKATKGKSRGLQVHHGWYGRDVEPWEYESDTLYCLCDSCHEQAETDRRVVYCELARIPPRFHRHIRDLLVQMQSLIEEDESLMSQAIIERG